MSDLLRVGRVFACRSSGVRARDLGDLLARAPAARAGGLDPLGVAAAWSELAAPDPASTCLRAVRVEQDDATWSALAAGAAPADVEEILPAAARRALSAARRPVVALGGGIDAPLAVLAARRSGIVVDRALTIAIPGTRYDESHAARANAAALGLDLDVIAIDVDDLVTALPEAVRHSACAFYNLHPVSRTLLARAARARGYDALLTGDGADQAARGAREHADYVPLVAALTRGAGLRWAAPFADEAVVTSLVTRARAEDARSTDPEHDPKAALRALAVAWGLPDRIAYAPKHATFAPPLPRAAFPDAARVERLARALDRPLAWSDDDRRNVGIASLAVLVEVLGVEV